MAEQRDWNKLDPDRTMAFASRLAAAASTAAATARAFPEISQPMRACADALWDAHEEALRAVQYAVDSLRDSALSDTDQELLAMCNQHISALDLSTRALNALEHSGIVLVGQLAALPPVEVECMKYVGQTTMKEIRARLAKAGLSLGHPLAAKRWRAPSSESDQEGSGE